VTPTLAGTLATLAATVPPVAAGGVAVLGPRLAVRMPPSTAVRILTGLGLLITLTCGFVLAAVAFTALAIVPAVAALGHWSPAALAGPGTLPVPVGAGLGILVAVLLTAASRRTLGEVRALATSEVTCRRIGPGVAGLVVMDDDAPDAYALPGLTGRIVVTTAMLQALPADERRVLLEHEASHLRHRHHVYVQLTTIAAAANPLLRPLVPAVRLAVERWADEDAAALVDRDTAVRALAGLARARAARSHAPTPDPLPGLAAVGSTLPQRTAALQRPAPAPRPALVAAAVALGVLVTVAAMTTSRLTEQRFERAFRADRAAAALPVAPGATKG